ncbi:MAG: dihydrofolate reductase [Paludibacteraceae bacterium]|nr:dihydrofolate reductase [Paludibacteraceae bacterium]
MNDTIQYHVDRFADIEVLRYRVPGFEDLSLRDKLLIYHLSEAALAGRDILFDQNCRYNLWVRQTLEHIYLTWSGDRQTADFQAFETYLKRVWFSSGIHHHYATNKFTPGFPAAYLDTLLNDTRFEGDRQLLHRLLFDPDFMAKRVNLQAGDDLVATSANHFYEGVTQQEALDYYTALSDSTDPHPVSHGLNSRLEKAADGSLHEVVWKDGGEYSRAIGEIIRHLEQASAYTENEAQRKVIELLIAYYRTGDLHTFDAYSIAWTQETGSRVDFINGFIETYGDPLSLKGSWESIVNFKNLEATRRTERISSSAQWFEDHSPIDPRFRKKEVKGVSAKVINAAILAGDSYPATPIGINLPNADWIRAEYGSKSVTLENIMQAYDKAAEGNGFAEEFYETEEDRSRLHQYGFLTDVLHTDLHECLGHGSGQLLPGTSPDALQSYASCLEETRADLFGLYFLADPELIELGVIPDSEAYKAEYYRFMLNGLMTQLVRIPLGEELEEAHMRNRQLIARWVYEQAASDQVVELVRHDGKTYLRINDYERLRTLFGRLLAEIQRIKSEGDYEAGKRLVETYAVKIDPVLHQEVLERYAGLHLAPYKGFVNPVYTLVRDAQGRITDVRIDYSEGYTDQMLRYAREYSFLTTK